MAGGGDGARLGPIGWPAAAAATAAVAASAGARIGFGRHGQGWLAVGVRFCDVMVLAAEMELGLTGQRVTGSAIWVRVGSRVKAPTRLFDPDSCSVL